MIKKPLLVIGGEHHNTLGVIRSLGEKGERPDVLLVNKNKKTFVGASKYINRVFFVDTAADVSSFLINTYPQKDDFTIVIACSDAVSSNLDENRNALVNRYLLPGAREQGAITHFMNKNSMAILANKVGLRTPPSWLLGANADLNNVEYPCITKPLLSKIGNKKDITICENEEKLKEYIKCHVDSITQVQKYIDKSMEYQLIGCSLEEEIIIPGYSEILRPCKGSNTSFLKYSPIEDGFCNMDSCHQFIRETGYLGLFSLEFIRDKEGNDYFLEMNFRNDGNSICVTASGINLPYIWYLSRLGEDWHGEITKPETVYVMPEFSETGLLLRGTIKLKEWFSDMRKTDRFMDYDKKDPRPFWKELYMKLFNIA